MTFLPKSILSPFAPPLKIQGIKTRLVPFIAENLQWDGRGTWHEPFMGSGVVGFNIQPERAVFSDINPHIVQFYKDIQSGEISPALVRDFLEEEGAKLAATPADKNSYYYQVRERFNRAPNSLDFLFLQRSNFNGVIRFSPNGYNVPFGRNPLRFNAALVSKVVEQIAWVAELLHQNDWEFRNCSWVESLVLAKEDDFFYFDPPYIGLNARYFTAWDESDADSLASAACALPCKYALSMWQKSQDRENEHLEKWRGITITTEHSYLVGGNGNNRKKIVEALVMSQ